MRTVRISSLAIGLLMIAQWIFFLSSANVPEISTAPVEIIFHIVIEMITAILLIMVFILLKKASKWKKMLSVYAQGMLGYTAVNSTGYFVQDGQWVFLLMFAAVLAFSILNTIMIIKMSQIK
jgi:hypothetical protein